MTSPIVDFLEARLAEDWEAATASITIVGDTWEASSSVVEIKGETKGRSVFEWTVCFDEGSPSEAQAEHIARHDPARVLREVAAKRAILEIHNARDSWGHCMGCGVDSDGSLYMAIDDCPTLSAVAAVYSDHPGYRKEWAV